MRTPGSPARPEFSIDHTELLQAMVMTLKSIERALEELGFNGAITRMPGHPTLGIGERLVLAVEALAANGRTPPRRPRTPAERGRIGGLVRSPAKAKSSRENGKRGGRPLKTAPPAPPARTALRIDEAAETLGISRAKCYDLVAKGLIPSIKLGKTRRVPVAALEAFLKANRMEDKR